MLRTFWVPRKWSCRFSCNTTIFWQFLSQLAILRANMKLPFAVFVRVRVRVQTAGRRTFCHEETSSRRSAMYCNEEKDASQEDKIQSQAQRGEMTEFHRKLKSNKQIPSPRRPGYWPCRPLSEWSLRPIGPSRLAPPGNSECWVKFKNTKAKKLK